MRKRLFDIIEASGGEDVYSSVYDWCMMTCIVLSLLPLAFKTGSRFFSVLDQATVIVFIIDYAMRLFTADYKLKKRSFSFFLYPLTPMAVIDLLSILPTFLALNHGLKLLKVFRLLRAMKVFRTLKFARYSSNIQLIVNVLRKQKRALLSVATLAFAFVMISALIIYNVEPDSFGTFFDAVYWATISLTTVGYGDIYPVTNIGRIVTMLSSVFGIAIIALPSGVITAGYLAEIRAGGQERKEGAEDRTGAAGNDAEAVRGILE